MVVVAMAMLQMEETTIPVTTVEMEVLPLATMATVVMEAPQLVVSLRVSHGYYAVFIERVVHSLPWF